MGSVTQQEIKFNYIKNNDFRTFYADGVFGGITPRMELQMDFFIERQVIPQVAYFKVVGDKIESKPIKTEGKEGLVREFSVGVLMNMEVATSFRNWLDNTIEEFTKIKKEIEEIKE